VDFLSIVGTRPQLIKLAPIISAFKENNAVHDYIDTGQHYDPNLSTNLLSDLKLPKPKANLGVGSGSFPIQFSQLLSGIDAFLLSNRPKCVLVYGDTNSTLAAALMAIRHKIPVAHIEAGLRSRNLKMVEEQNRVMVDHVSDFLFAPTTIAMKNLELENLKYKSQQVGDVMYDVVLHSNPHPKKKLKIQAISLCRQFTELKT